MIFMDPEKEAKAFDAPYCNCPVTTMLCVLRISSCTHNPGHVMFSVNSTIK
jgi:hypothetical protein